ncbi:hypothetical protein EON73_05155 [bacterium]|nr:MAG: hypothetical protein EON73_05155 [bacterium]
MKKSFFNEIIFAGGLMVCISCNQVNKPENTNIVQSNKSEFKDSTSFTKGVKVLIKQLAQMKVIENVTIKNGRHYYLIAGKQYEANDLQSLD